MVGGGGREEGGLGANRDRFGGGEGLVPGAGDAQKVASEAHLGARGVGGLGSGGNVDVVTLGGGIHQVAEGTAEGRTCREQRLQLDAAASRATTGLTAFPMTRSAVHHATMGESLDTREADRLDLLRGRTGFVVGVALDQEATHRAPGGLGGLKERERTVCGTDQERGHTVTGA